MDATQGVTTGASLFICLLGVVAIAGGLYLVLKSRSLSRRCTEETTGTIAEILDEGFKDRAKGPGWARKPAAKRGGPADEEPVVAANEAIAAKKRAYNAKKRRQAEMEAQAAASTWRPVVRYAVAGQTFDRRATRGVGRDRYKVGQTCAVHYDPAKPAYCWLAIDGLPKTFGQLLVICGAVLILVGVACWFVLPYIANLSQGVY